MAKRDKNDRDKKDHSDSDEEDDVKQRGIITVATTNMSGKKILFSKIG